MKNLMTSLLMITALGLTAGCAHGGHKHGSKSECGGECSMKDSKCACSEGECACGEEKKK